MKSIKNWLFRAFLMAALMLGISGSAHATDITFDGAVTTALGSATTLFGLVITLSVLVTGFGVGRAWLRRVK